MAAPIVIRSTDPGVPEWKAVLGQAIIFFDYVLVTRLGWTKEFSGAYKAVYRPPSGNRLFYRIDNSIANEWYGVYSLTTYEAMTDVDTGTGAAGPVYTYLATAYQTPIEPWIAIGDARGLWLWTKSGTKGALRYMGDGLPIFSNDAWFSLISGYVGNSSISPQGIGALDYDINDAYRSQLYCWRRMSGDLATLKDRTYLKNGGGMCFSASMAYSGLPTSLNYPTDGKLLYTRPYLSDGSLDRTLRGYLPGLYCPEHPSGSLVEGNTYIDGDKTLLFLPFSSDRGAGGVFIDIGGGFRS